jgi:uncharacterized protein YciI
MLFSVRFHDRSDRANVRREYLPAHIAWLDEHRHMVLVGGSLRKEQGENPVGGLWLVEAPDKNAVEALISSDPFTIHGLREQYEIFFWSKAFPERKVSV